MAICTMKAIFRNTLTTLIKKLEDEERKGDPKAKMLLENLVGRNDIKVNKLEGMVCRCLADSYALQKRDPGRTILAIPIAIDGQEYHLSEAEDIPYHPKDVAFASLLNSARTNIAQTSLYDPEMDVLHEFRTVSDEVMVTVIGHALSYILPKFGSNDYNSWILPAKLKGRELAKRKGVTYLFWDMHRISEGLYQTYDVYVNIGENGIVYSETNVTRSLSIPDVEHQHQYYREDDDDRANLNFEDEIDIGDD